MDNKTAPLGATGNRMMTTAVGMSAIMRRLETDKIKKQKLADKQREREALKATKDKARVVTKKLNTSKHVELVYLTDKQGNTFDAVVMDDECYLLDREGNVDLDSGKAWGAVQAKFEWCAKAID